MKKYLFYRTDRVGDFLMSSILINSIKRNDPSAYITVIASNKNYNYIKSLKLVDETFIYPNNFLKKISFFYALLKKNYFISFVLDGKKRSIYGALLTKSKIKILFTTKYFYKKILFKFFDHVIFNQEFSSKIEEIKFILKKLDYNYLIEDLNTLKKENIYTNNKQLIDNTSTPYNIFHFDEKWIKGKYIDKYANIEPQKDDLIPFFKRIIDKTKANLIITTGFYNNSLVEFLKNNFSLLDNNVYIYKYNNNNIFLLTKLDFNELRFIIKNQIH